jgi:hypothetical protein
MDAMKPNDLVRPVALVMRREIAETRNTATMSKQIEMIQSSMAA